MVRRTAVLGFALLALLTGSAGARVQAVPAPVTSFVFAGHGYGHGIGMSQYGALGYAQHGFTYPQILAHYYPGTTLGSAAGITVRVLLAEKKKALTVSSTAPFSVRDGVGATHQLAAGAFTFGPGLVLRAVPAIEGSAGTALPGPLLLSPGSAPLALAGNAYRGQLRAIVTGKTLEAINVLGLESYLYGVVPSEMPYIWSADALEAQAVAARSYALATRKQTGDFDVYGDVRSQAYGGIAAERLRDHRGGGQDAAPGAALQGQGRDDVLLDLGRPRRRDPGRLAEVRPGALPRLGPRPVRRALSLAQLGPGARRRRQAEEGAQADRARARRDRDARCSRARRLGARDGLGRRRGHRSGRHAADAARAALDVVLGRRPLARRRRGSGGLRLERRPLGSREGVAAPTLQQRLAGGLWEPVGAVTPDGSGAFQLTETPEASTDYRLVAGKANGPPLHVGVAPLVTLAALPGSDGVSGTVQPLLMGATVGLQQQVGTAWTTVTTATVDESGNFQAILPLQAGALYRARVAPGQGFAVGLSEPLSAP